MNIRFLLLTPLVFSISLISAGDRPFQRRQAGADIHGFGSTFNPPRDASGQQTAPGSAPLVVPGWVNQEPGTPRLEPTSPSPSPSLLTRMGVSLQNQDHIDTVTLAAHNHFASWPYFFMDYASDMIKAAALRARNPHLMRTLYLATAGIKGVNGLSATTSALAPLVPSYGYTILDGAIIWRRLIAGISAIDDVAGTANSIKMLRHSGTLARLYKKKPELRKQLDRTSNKRLLNRTISMAIATAVLATLYKFRSSGSRMSNFIIASLIYNILSNMILNRNGENPDLEDQLIAQARTVLKKKKQKKEKVDHELDELEAELA